MLVLIVNIESGHHVPFFVFSLHVPSHLVFESAPGCSFGLALFPTHTVVVDARRTHLLRIIVEVSFVFELFAFFQAGSVLLQRLREFIFTFLNTL